MLINTSISRTNQCSGGITSCKLVTLPHQNSLSSSTKIGPQVCGIGGETMERKASLKGGRKMMATFWVQLLLSNQIARSHASASEKKRNNSQLASQTHPQPPTIQRKYKNHRTNYHVETAAEGRRQGGVRWGVETKYNAERGHAHKRNVTMSPFD